MRGRPGIMSWEYWVRVPRTLKMRRGVYSLRVKARNTAPMPVFSSVWQIAWGLNSAFKTPHTGLPRRPFGGVSFAVLGSVRSVAHLLVLRVAFRVFVGDYLRRSRPRVQSAKAAITGEYVTQMVARLECGVLAVPVHSALSDTNLRAPRGIARGMAWRSSKRRRRCKSSDTKRQFRKGFQHNEALLGFPISPLK